MTTPREWFAAGELAGLAGMPGTIQGVHKRARRDGWESRPRTGRGGGREYHWRALPPETQAALLASEPDAAELAQASSEAEGKAAKDAFQYDPEELSRWAESCTARKKAEGRRRAQILHQVMALVDCGTPFRRAAEIVARQRGDVSPASIRNWYYGANRQPGAQEYRRCDWSLALIPRHRGGQVTADCSTEAWEAFKADYLRPEQPSAAACYDRLKRLAREHGWQIPSCKTLERRIDREIPRAALIFARQGPERLGLIYNSGPRDRSHLTALEAVNADGHRFDVRVEWPDGTIDRPWLTAWQDLASGMLVGWRIGPSESSDSYRLSFYDVLRLWGIPRHVYVDNGRGIASKMLTGGQPNRYRFRIRAEDPTGLLTDLGCRVHWTTPYSGQSKPVERAFRDLCETIARHPQLSGAYTGGSVATKPHNYGERAIPLAEFLALVGREIDAHNAREGRRSAVCQGRSFEQVFRASYERNAERIEKPSTAQLRRWMLMAERVTADKRSGAVQLLGNTYWAECMARFVDLPAARRQVIAAFDPDHLSDGIYVYTLDQREVGHLPAQSTRFNSTEDARRVARERREFRRRQRQALAAERRMSATELGELHAGTGPQAPASDPAEQRVVRGAFGRERRVAGSDVQPGGEPDEYQSRFEELMLRAGEAWRENVLPVGGGSNEES